MATKQTVSEFFTELNLLTNNKFGSTTDGVKLRYLNRAILNRVKELRTIVPAYQKHTVVTTLASQELDLPTDCDTETTFLLYQDVNYHGLLPQTYYRKRENKIFFATVQTAGTNYYLEYTKEPSRYTLITDTIDETESIRALEILQTEVEHIRDVDIYQGQISGQAQAAQARTNNIS